MLLNRYQYLELNMTTSQKKRHTMWERNQVRLSKKDQDILILIIIDTHHHTIIHIHPITHHIIIHLITTGNILLQSPIKDILTSSIIHPLDIIMIATQPENTFDYPYNNNSNNNNNNNINNNKQIS